MHSNIQFLLPVWGYLFNFIYLYDHNWIVIFTQLCIIVYLFPFGCYQTHKLSMIIIDSISNWDSHLHNFSRICYTFLIRLFKLLLNFMLNASHLSISNKQIPKSNIMYL
jgi:hypothetical protein